MSTSSPHDIALVEGTKTDEMRVSPAPNTSQPPATYRYSNLGDDTPRPIDPPFQDPRPVYVRITESVRNFLPLSVIAFGGPPAHIALLHNTFVARKKWLDDALFSEFFAVSQALPGPGSTEMLFSIAIHRGGLIPAIAGFFCWSLPGLVIMTALALGVSRLPNPLPIWLTQLQNGISAAVVGLVAQAAVSLARKIVNDNPTLFIATIAAAARVLYSASWLEPVVVALGGLASLVAIRGSPRVREWRKRREDRKKKVIVDREGSDVEMNNTSSDNILETQVADEKETAQPEKISTSEGHTPMSWQAGIAVFAITLILLIAFIALKSTLANIRPLAVFTQFYVAGCIIFGGGPVVIPLLYSYVVTPGYVTDPDFLLGVALIQAMPGPNFNFAPYLGCLALSPFGPGPAIGGALLGYIAIFLPGLALNAASMPLWQKVRKNKVIGDVLPGMNAAAVGLVFSAGYLLWQKGVLRDGGVRALGDFPFYAVVAGIAYVLVDGGVKTPYVMVGGVVAGLLGWGFNV
ncbi:hypothetical protein HK097_001141 [Rhizophlyctis rosea]|uniref:Chromate transporter n=1 Tax=Rhizophlyctis rosea TaxID=64517 RepID=A0AAD5S729_9FUNG|nr:hypothetical protein HK097_001141 [Rhizophlyctis rosea]